MAARLGLSVSYLSQLENDNRPLTAPIAARLAKLFPLDWSDGRAAAARREAALKAVFDDPLFDDLERSSRMARAMEQQPALAELLIRLHTAWRDTHRQRQIADEALSSGVPGATRLPWEEIRDWFHEAGNYIDPLDRAAEALAGTLGPLPAGEARLAAFLKERNGVELREMEEGEGEGVLRRFEAARGLLLLGRGLPPETRRFMIAHQIGAQNLADELASVLDRAALPSPEGRRLLTAGLLNYAAAALLMPYGPFRRAARAMRHDIDRLCQRFQTSFEQTCHRLSTLQRPGERGIPFFFCRVDMAGNITKRHSATRLQFARFGGACPLWIVHEAVAIPDRVLVQLAETPDGVRYVSMAKGLVKPSGSYARPPRRYAVALGCEAAHAQEFIYADGIDTAKRGTPIGISCRLCPRTGCDQRAFPPSDRPIAVDPNLREFVPYRVL
ncbi:helix-turn-helix domain-containing protein [Aureimonas populi]|nr:helix-turn-helix transcriptional regulator [Aureimonas populi]